MIRGWKGREARAIFEGMALRSISIDLARAARRRLAQLDSAASVEDMRAPPGNRLHRIGAEWAIRVNDQFRITFVWGSDGPTEVWFGDYH